MEIEVSKKVDLANPIDETVEVHIQSSVAEWEEFKAYVKEQGKRGGRDNGRFNAYVILADIMDAINK